MPEDRDRLEKDIESTAVGALTRRGYYCPKYKTPGRRSAPDRICLGGSGYCFFIEFKRVGKGPTEKQELEHEKLRKRGYLVRVCTSTSEAQAAADEFENLVIEQSKGLIARWKGRLKKVVSPS